MSITKNLSETLKELNSLVARLEKSSRIEPIEVDLALAKTRTIYEYLLNLNANKEKPEESPSQLLIENSEEFAEEEIASVKETTITSTTQITYKKEEKETEPIMELEEEKKESEKHPEEVKPVTQISVKEVKTETQIKTSEGDIIAEKFKRTEPLINEVLSKMGKKDLSSLLQSKPIKNIESAIGINERFEFVRTLFSGDNATYLKTIRILDNSANFNEAFNYINQTFSWDYENETVHKLLDLVRRRYITE